jgi:hypothetical protein
LFQAWKKSSWLEEPDINDEKVASIEHLLSSLKYEHKADKHHLAEAMALGASWFITNDKNIINITCQKKSELSNLTDEYMLDDPQLTTNQILKRLLNITTVVRPSQCVKELERTMTLK